MGFFDFFRKKRDPEEIRVTVMLDGGVMVNMDDVFQSKAFKQQMEAVREVKQLLELRKRKERERNSASSLNAGK